MIIRPWLFASPTMMLLIIVAMPVATTHADGNDDHDDDNHHNLIDPALLRVFKSAAACAEPINDRRSALEGVWPRKTNRLPLRPYAEQAMIRVGCQAAGTRRGAKMNLAVHCAPQIFRHP